jgi:deoxyribonuclease IV
MDKLLFATAGIPLSTQPRDTLNGISQVRALGLGAMELEFVQSVNVSAEKAPLVKKLAEEKKVVLTAHGSYYINLNSPEKPKWHASISRIVQAGVALEACGGYSLVFHPAFYLKSTKEEAYQNVKKGIEHAISELEKKGCKKIWVRPETMGRESQFGTLEENLQLSVDIPRVLPCIDFSHLHARYGGKFNTYDEFHSQLSLVEKMRGKEALQNIHAHLSGIAYGPKGEQHHLPLAESDMNYKDLLRALKEFGCAGVVVCESPNIEEDALLLKKTYEKS